MLISLPMPSLARSSVKTTAMASLRLINKREAGNSKGQGYSGVTLYTERLQRDRACRSTDQGVGSNPKAKRNVRRGSTVGAGKVARSQAAGGRKHGPRHDRCRRNAYVETNAALPSAIALDGTDRWAKLAVQPLEGPDDEANPGSASALQDAGLRILRLATSGQRYSKRQKGYRSLHGSSPLQQL
jgi:hypothetical protein